MTKTIKLTINQRLNQARIDRGFEVHRENGIKHGYTVFFDQNEKIEAKYNYFEDRFDYLGSTGINSGSLSFDRVKGCNKANKKLKDKSYNKLARFFSMEKGFYSIEDLYRELFINMKTSMERLESIERKVKLENSGHLKRWCEATICGCLGCANRMLSWSKEEHSDYMLYLRAKELGLNPEELKGK